MARAAAQQFELSTTAGELARRGKAKSKRSDLRVVGLAALVSETGHAPLLHRTYPGNGSDQTVLRDCLAALGKLHEALDDAEQRTRPACRTLMRDGGAWYNRTGAARCYRRNDTAGGNVAGPDPTVL
jgi:hypothetical protein